MNATGLVSILFGAVIILSRAPLLFAPEATRVVYLKILATTTRVRLLGLAIFVLGLALVLAPSGLHDFAEVFITCVGWLLMTVSFIGPIVFAFLFQPIAEALLQAMDDLMLRGLGVVSVGAGAWFIYFGIAIW